MKRLTYQQPHYLPQLHEELMAAIPGLRPIPAPSGPPGVANPMQAVMQISGDGQTVDMNVPDQTVESQVAAVVAAHVPTPPLLVWQYVETKTVAQRLTTTDGNFREVYRLPTRAQSLYRATFSMSAIDAVSFDVKDSQARLVFKRNGGALTQVGTTIALGTAQDTAASAWTIQAQASGTDLVIGVRGAAGRTINWILAGDVALFTPAGL